ncbi:Alpha/Beta hydrolase protein [Kalaharituber pfeilii]|nr:Alpha/Beta hydrolase protein [Kalaharituber pfeilii]
MQLPVTVLSALCSLVSTLPASITSHLPPSLTSDCDLLVTTARGITYKGFSPNPTVRAFLGIPYAQPPVNSLRWKPPQPLPAASERERVQIVDATKFGNSCYQFMYKIFYRDPRLGKDIENYGKTQTPESEDCLSVNVWAPRKGKKGKEEDELLPVMVWVHGGAHHEGGSSTPGSDGTNLVTNHNNILYVSFNYRLNIFGFPMTPSVPLNQTNLGLFDQRFVVEWLRDNIAAFGGDPKQMTLWGESAGSVSVGTYLFAYPDDPIVRAGIAQSYYDLGDGYPSEFGRVAKNAGCGSEDEKVQFECMMKAPADRIHRGISNETYNRFGAMPGGKPVVDNITVFSKEGYAQRAKEGKIAPIPLLLGSNNHEADALLPYDFKDGVNKTLSDIYTITALTCPTSMLAKQLAALDIPVYLYRYMPILPAANPVPWPRAYHSAELPFIFGNLPPGHDFRPYEKRICDAIQRMWVAFAKNPTGANGSGVGWPRYRTGNMTDTLAELFGVYTDPNGNYTGRERHVEVVSATKWDKECANPPRIPWEEFGIEY